MLFGEGLPVAYSFEDFSLDPDRRELHRGGVFISIEPLVFDLLEYLIRNRDRVVTKDDLIASVWRGRIVSESALMSRINAARNAVADSGAQQRFIRTIPRKGFRFVGEVRDLTASPQSGGNSGGALQLSAAGQAVTFCQTKDRINLAVASVGRGPTVVRAALWATHIEYDWDGPMTGPLLRRLAERFRLVRYDGRGAGLSDRNVGHISFSTMLEDLETVVDCCGLDRFALLGISGGAATSIAYAVRHPERVTKLVLVGGYARGRNKRGEMQSAEEAKAFMTMLRSGWGNEHSFFMRAFSSFFIPGASEELVKSFTEFQRVATSGENAQKLRAAVDEIDIADILHEIKVPTIVFHCIHDNLVPFDQGRLLAASIPDARFIVLESANHALLSNEPAWDKFVREMEAFLEGDTASSSAG